MASERTRELIHLRYGTDRGIDLELDKSRLRAAFRSPNQTADLTESVRHALDNPLDFPPLEQSVIPDDHVAIVVEPDLPGSATILAGIWERISARGITPENVTILQTTSGDCPPEDPRGELPPEVRDRVKRKVHEPPSADDDTLHYLATTAGGERVYLAEELVFADVVVAIGRIGFDPILGFRGTHSAFYPGFSSTEAIRKSQGQGHSELDPENERPLRAQVDEIGWLLGAAYTIQAIPAREGGLSEIITGASESVQRRGREQLTTNWRLEVGERADAVVVAVDHTPGQNGWTQLAAALALARRLVTRGGRIIALTQLDEPPGDGITMLRGAEDPNDALPALREAMPDDFLPATQFAAALDWATIYLLSDLEGDLVEDLGCVPVENEAEISRLLAGIDDDLLLIESAQYADGRVR